MVNLVLPTDGDDPDIVCARRIMGLAVTAVVTALAVSAWLLF